MPANSADSASTRNHPTAGSRFIATAPQFRNASLDRAARQPGCARGRGDAARALRQRFVGGEQSPGAFIEEDRCFPPTRADVGDVDHTATLADASRVAPSKFSDSIRALLAALDSFISPRVLRVVDAGEGSLHPPSIRSSP